MSTVMEKRAVRHRAHSLTLSSVRLSGGYMKVSTLRSVPLFAMLLSQTTVVRNDLSQPYRTTRNWGELPPGVKWAAVTAIEPSPDGTIYVVHRCFENSCAGRQEAPILKYDSDGKLLKTWGQNMFVFPH